MTLSCMAFMLLIPSMAQGRCPSLLFHGELEQPYVGSRASLRLFALSPDPPKILNRKKQPRLVWKPQALQVDPVDDQGRLLFPGEGPTHDLLDPKDLLSFEWDDAGQKGSPKNHPLPCSRGPIYELSDSRQTHFAYLTQCDPSAVTPSFPTAVTFDQGGHGLWGGRYHYQFNPSNYLLFDQIKFQNNTGVWDEVAQDSRMSIRADVRNFFTMHFDSSQIESKLERTRLGPVADLARLSFFLRILFFKLDISLSTDVAFFAEAGHIPMMLNIPVNAERWLNPGSGILYSWILSPKAQKGSHLINMPRLDPALVKKGWEQLSHLGRTHCRGDECLYQFGVQLDGRHLVMEMRLERRLVERGFFPMYIDDVAAQSHEMDWPLDRLSGSKRVGLYFDVSGLPKGGHPWNFWLKLGDQTSHQETCPEAVKIRRIL